ncbi:uncharacterized protein LOC120265801 isoform X2 [Dioscorea cayenensis subsp. rotundata]|uniref:Uncharacterized protein LOC120265801 isoform X2 n=1 Tax=Dioscorea cayennensis subsp. rotundata TaxID=55577 RepID=A0AB40BTD2_DIOCR|nr:uncharacterized protein LOC120265801 isoform X2 [Dioscorea cayenensis subsp. rotundata]
MFVSQLSVIGLMQLVSNSSTNVLPNDRVIILKTSYDAIFHNVKPNFSNIALRALTVINCANKHLSCRHMLLSNFSNTDGFQFLLLMSRLLRNSKALFLHCKSFWLNPCGFRISSLAILIFLPCCI